MPELRTNARNKDTGSAASNQAAPMDEQEGRMRQFRGLIGAVVVLALAASGSANARGHGEGMISGRVTAVTGEPLGEICVAAHEYEEWAERSTVTEEDGTYSLDYLREGTYKIRFSDCSFRARYAPQWYAGAEDWATATEIELSPGAEVGGIDAALDVGGVIAGTVMGEDGTPASICVSVHDRRFGVIGSAFAEAGAYAVGGLPTGEFKVHFGCDSPGVFPAPKPVPPPRPEVIVGSESSSPVPSDNYVSEWYDDKRSFEEADSVGVEKGGTTHGIDAVLALGGTIAGTIVDEAGSPITDACISVYGRHGEAGFAYADENGEYEVPRLASGGYKVQFSDCSGEQRYKTEWYDNVSSIAKATVVEVLGGQLTAGIDAALAKRPRPDAAIADIVIENVPLRTDAADLPSSGMNRKVTVELANYGNAPALEGVGLQVWVETVSDGRVRQLGRTSLPLRAGEVVRRSFAWNGAGSLGDARVFAQACTYDDSDHSNDILAEDHYVIVGGTGIGVTLGRRPSWIEPCQEEEPSTGPEPREPTAVPAPRH